MEKNEKPSFRISVRNLVEFLLRSGDLDSRQGSGDKEAMAKGSRLHRKIQRRMGGRYQPEVTLKDSREYESFYICVEGRADGVFEDDDGWAVDEIKGVYLDVRSLSEPIPVHLAQAKCYAYMIACQKGLSKVRVQMTYCHLDTEEIRRFLEEYTLDELSYWYDGLLAEYYQWVDFSWQWKQRRNRSMQNLEFPFPYRPGQREIAAGVYGTISRKKHLFLQAPTGTGKTMSVVFPSVRAVGEGLADKIFYLTAKTIARTVAEEAFTILKREGLDFKVVTITAKEKLCPMEQPSCNPEECPYAKGHYDRINDSVFEALTKGESYTREALLAHAQSWKVCPFELCLDLSIWVDGVICDYNYVFDPNVYLKRFFSENAKEAYIFLVDEAHNLVDRGREMYSAILYKEDVLALRRLIKPYDSRIARRLLQINECLLALKRECEGGCQVLQNTGSLPTHLMNLMGEMERYLEESKGEEEIRQEVLDFYFQVRNFLNIQELLDENYVIYSELEEDGRFKLKLFCVNPAENLQRCLDKGTAAVFFSATLLPLAYYRSLFCTTTDDFAICARSPFLAERRCLLLARDVSSRYKRRGYTEYQRIASYIACTAAAKPGNYMVFFPSHQLLQEVCQIYQEEFADESSRLFVQSPSMGEEEREEFLHAFCGDGAPVLGFCVMGGIFSEGIDLQGEQLIGVIIVGTGLPQVSREREILKNYYDGKGRDGFDYAYRIPGMNKVLQAAGRLIRTKTDEGVILLLDERFHQAGYRQLFPGEWANYKGCSLGNVQALLMEFWASRRMD